MSKISILGHQVEIIDRSEKCTRSDADHGKLVRDARDDSRRMGFQTAERFVLCMHCGKAIPLEV